MKNHSHFSFCELRFEKRLHPGQSETSGVFTASIIRRFTLIELLVVMLLMGLIMSLMLPAFNRMIRGNRVDQLASGLKLGLELAQSNAVRARRHVALVLPNDRSAWGGSGSTAQDEALRLVQPFSHGGFRLAYVKASGSGDDWEFVRWVPGQEWKNAPDGAMLVRVMEKDESDFNAFQSGDAVTGVAEDLDSNSEFEPLANLTNLNDGDVSDHGVDHCLIVFSPYGGLVDDQDLRLVIAEALPSGNDILYPTQEAGGTEDDEPRPVNWKMLSINKFTGRVEYYPLPE